MNEFFEFFNSVQIDYIVLVFLMFFGCGAAIFHTLIITGLFNVNLHPKWIFFAINPVIVGLSFLYKPGYALLAIAFFFASILVLMISGMIYSSIKSVKETNKENDKLDKKYNRPKTTTLNKILGAIGALVFLALFILLIFSGTWALLFVIVPIILIIKRIFFPSNKSNFYKLQEVLPTSKANAVAMGVVELIGDLVALELLISPHFKEPCIGYLFTIEEESTDKDGKSSYRTIFTECKTNTFKIKDETGSVMVEGEGLEYYITNIDKQVQSGRKRYSETYLKNDDYLFLIGNATSNNGETLIKKDSTQKVFGVAIPREVALRNKFQPLLISFLTTLFFITLTIIYIILN
ncbi:hypothetical protein EZJ43_15175 [Pedobacter changchengzhani]|uniref:RING-type E3 ubiquitin transferase n=1 Tax=Pedobacter changchengzhani TaxID=2529274 RepID=A0A4R5MIB5_9SPHI|nr:hypothetical protein [Pedobacter changchengzhani]TDG35066.1 hypothetical protein EZJ43_15175 [Pedobacter changchengzhani]